MALLVKGEITITKGFETWKNMVYQSKDKLEEYGISFLFAGTQMDDETKLHIIFYTWGFLMNLISVFVSIF